MNFLIVTQKVKFFLYKYFRKGAEFEIKGREKQIEDFSLKFLKMHKIESGQFNG